MLQPLLKEILLTKSLLDVFSNHAEPMAGEFLFLWVMCVLGCICIGACLGSFATVICARGGIPLRKQKNRSVCPQCGKQLGILENVPLIGWIWLLGRCRGCRKKIPVKYLVSEITHTLIWVLPLLMTGPGYSILISLALSAMVIPLQKNIWNYNQSPKHFFKK